MIPAGYRRALREHDLRKAMEPGVEQMDDDDQELTLTQILAIGGFVCFVTVFAIFALAARYGETVAAFLSGR